MTAPQRFGVRASLVAARRAISRRTAARVLSRSGAGFRGQSLAEFAIVIPVLLLLTMIALDFGRMYLGYINLENLTRAAANFAANNPTAWSTNNAAVITQYQNQVINDAANSNCTLNPTTPAPPVFSDSNRDGVTTGIGDYTTVRLNCTFHVITPVISRIIGSSVVVSATSVFPVKSGQSGTGGGGGSCLLPVPAINASPKSGSAPLTVVFADGSGGGAGISWLWKFGDPNIPDSTVRDPGSRVYTTAGSFTVTLAVTNLCGTVTTTPGTIITVSTPAQPQCTVPTLDGLKRNSAQGAWGTPKPPGAGFTTTVQSGPGAGNGNYTILTQSIVAGSIVDCGSTIYVNDH